MWQSVERQIMADQGRARYSQVLPGTVRISNMIPRGMSGAEELFFFSLLCLLLKYCERLFGGIICLKSTGPTPAATATG